MSLHFRPIASCSLLLAAACGGGSSAAGAGSVVGSTFAGTYGATFAGTFQNTSPNTESGSSTSSATITVTALPANDVELSWQVPPNPPSGTAVFQMDGANGSLAAGDASGTGVTGSCFTGLVNGNTQTNCCTVCSIAFSGNTFSQPNAGTYTGTTPAGVNYTGTYSGTWTGTRQ